MAMIDIGVKIEISTQAATNTVPASWTVLRECTGIPQLMQPAAKISTDFVGDEFTGEILGKRGITGLDFGFAFDGTGQNKQFRTLNEMSRNTDDLYWLRITMPDETKIELLVQFEVSLGAIAPSAEVDYTMSCVAKNPAKELTGEAKWDGLINIVYAGESDPLAAA